MMTGPGTNTYFVGLTHPILIDTGAGVPGYMPLLEAYLGRRGWQRPERIVLTHRHRDHIGGVTHLRERFPGIAVSKMIWKDDDLPEGIQDLRDGETVAGDGVTLVSIHTPGHASDHLCYYLPEEQALFTGDLVLNGSHDGDPRRGRRSRPVSRLARRVQRLGVRRIYPAHGAVIEDAPGKIQEYLDHRMLRERQILETLGSGVHTIPEIVKAIYADVPVALHGHAAMSVHSHLKKLRQEARVAEEAISGSPSRWRLVS